MSLWEYEAGIKIAESNETRTAVAVAYVRACLEISDGTVDKGMARIGTERFDEIVRRVIAVIPKGQ